MNEKDDIVTRFLSLSPEQKKYLLSSLAHQITVCARAAYSGQIEEDKAQEKLRICNELQHTVTGQLVHLMAEDKKWYDDTDFLGILFDKARMGNAENDLIWAFQFALAHLRPPPSRS